jgi:hypothetical protein
MVELPFLNESIKICGTYSPTVDIILSVILNTNNFFPVRVSYIRIQYLALRVETYGISS